MADYKSKRGKVSYSVICDTHGYPWGTQEADFDLGDNTNTYPNPVSFEPIMAPRARKLAILGNHDIAQLLVESGLQIEKNDEAPVTMPDDKEWRRLQEYADHKHRVYVFGTDSAKTFHYYIIPKKQILEIAERLLTLEEDWDVIVLTHPPLYPIHENAGSCHKRWDRVDESLRNAENEPASNYFNSPRMLMRVLTAFQEKGKVELGGKVYDYSDKTSNNVIGCFCGHIHNSVKCAVSLSDYDGEEGSSNTKIYMQAFPTNGSNESIPENAHNPGMYIPDKCFISIDFDNKTVNGRSYVNPSDEWVIENIHHGKPLCDRAIGQYTFSQESNLVPKFYRGLCIGWTNGSNPLVIYGSNMHSTGGVLVKGLNKYVDFLRFSASGLLKYYVERGHTEQRIIPDFDTAKISFISDHGVHWVFRGGRLVYVDRVKK